MKCKRVYINTVTTRTFPLSIRTAQEEIFIRIYITTVCVKPNVTRVAADAFTLKSYFIFTKSTRIDRFRFRAWI